MDAQQDRLVAGRYRLRSPLGSGGSGTVWRASDEVLGREVAVKEVVPPHGLSDDERAVLRERTRREARAAAKLDHPGAVTVFDVVEEDGRPYLVMELVEARTLSQVVRADGPLSPERTAQVGLELLGALAAAHRQGILHRDVKPGNVLLADSGRVVLTDFGIASSAGDTSITSTGLLLGSPAYIAPERARGQAPGPASDLWSLGATLFTAVEGRPPFDEGEPLLTVTAVVTGEHAPFSRAGRLQPVLEALLARDPAARCDAATASGALERVAAGQDAGLGPSGAEDPTATVAVPLPELPGAGPGAPDDAKAPSGSSEALRSAERTTVLPVDGVRQTADAGSTAPSAPAPPAAAPAPAATLPAEPAEPAEPAPVVPWDRPERPGARTTAPDRRSRLPVALGAVALLLAGAVVALVLVTDPARRPVGTAAPAAPTTSAPADAQDVPELPAGWTRYVEPTEGWSIGVPPGFQRSTYRGTQVQLRDPQTRRTLRIDYTPDPGPDPVAAWERLSPQLASSLASYQQVRLEPVDYLGLEAAELEFTYFDETELRVVDRGFLSPDGDRGFALYWQVPADGFADSLGQFAAIADTFDPDARAAGEQG